MIEIFNINKLQNQLSKINKRSRLLLGVVIQVFLMLLATFFYFENYLFFIALFFTTSILITYFVILEKIKGFSNFGIFFMPLATTIITYLFYFLFPVRWLTRFPLIIFFSILFYANLLISNIFFVGVEKNLQLYRPAFTLNYLFQTLLIFFSFSVLYSLKQNFLVNFVVSFFLFFFFSLHLFWSIRLNHYLENEVKKAAFIMGLIGAELAFFSSFIPWRTSVAALQATAVYYSLGGIWYHYLDKRLFKETIREYTFVMIFVLLISLLTLNF